MAATVEVIIEGRDNTGGMLGNIGGGLSNLANIVTGVKAGFDMLAGAFGAVVDFGAQFVNEAIESQDAIANLEATLRSMGDVTGLSSQQLQDMAGALQNVTRFSDETIMNGQAMLLTFGNIGGEIFPQATEAMLDLAAKFGSVDQASVMLGKALNDPIAGVTALRRVGVQLSEQQEEAIKKFMEVGDIASAQGIILGELERQVGGLAEAYGNTFAGKLEILRNRFSEIKEVIGNSITPILTFLLDKFSVFMPTLEAFGAGIANIFATLNVGLQEDNWMFFFGALERMDIFIGNIFQKIANAIQDWANGSGPQELADTFTSWIDGIGNDSGTDSRIVTGLQRIIDALARAADSIDWASVRTAIGTAFGRIFEGMDLQGSATNLITRLSTFLNNVNWQPLAQTVADFISDAILIAMNGLDILVNQVDWSPVGEALRGALSEIISGMFSSEAGAELDTRLNTFFTNAINGAMPGIVVSIIEGFNGGILNGVGLVSLGLWVHDHIIKPVKEALGIASPSTVFFGIGRDIIAGLMGGFAAMISPLIALIDYVVSAILAPFAPIFDLLGIDIGGTGSLGSHTTGTTTGGTGTTTGTTTGSGTVVNQYFSGATINVGSWDEIAYDCIYPNPFVAATSGRLGGSGGGTGAPR